MNDVVALSRPVIALEPVECGRPVGKVDLRRAERDHCAFRAETPADRLHKRSAEKPGRARHDHAFHARRHVNGPSALGFGHAAPVR